MQMVSLIKLFWIFVYSLSLIYSNTIIDFLNIAGGIAGMCSQDGRHLALMPHPERCTLPWQQPYGPPEWRQMTAAPWLTLFHNMYQWASEQQQR